MPSFCICLHIIDFVLRYHADVCYPGEVYCIHGTCRVDNDGLPQCQCRDGWVGEKCDMIAPTGETTIPTTQITTTAVVTTTPSEKTTADIITTTPDKTTSADVTTTPEITTTVDITTPSDSTTAENETSEGTASTVEDLTTTVE